MSLKYSYHNIINSIGIILFNGTNIYNNSIPLNNNNYLSFYNSSDIILNNFNPCRDFFQTEEITNLIFNYIRSDKIKNNIIKLNKFNKRYNNNNDLFIHIRLSDAKKYNVGVNYYLKCINDLNFDNIYIASDSLNDEIIIYLINKYPNIKLINANEINTIHFGSTCKYVILSHGSFSAIIGYLSFYSTIFYPNIEPKWCPLGMFTNKNFIPINNF